MSGGAGIEVAELVLPGAEVADGARVAQAMHRELGRLWREDQQTGLQWKREIGAVTMDLDDALVGDRLGEAIAREIRHRALIGSERR